jgi:hypothetical protein
VLRDVESNTSAAEIDAACLALDALHAHVEASYEALVTRKAEREAAEAARVAAEAVNPAPPPKPKDTLIQFWKVETPPNPPPSPGSSDATNSSANGEVQP